MDLSFGPPPLNRRVLTCERTVAARQDKCTDTLILVKLLERGVELGEERGGECVQRLRAVERDLADTVRGARRQDELVLGGSHEANANGCGGVAVSTEAAKASGGGGGDGAESREHVSGDAYM